MSWQGFWNSADDFFGFPKSEQRVAREAAKTQMDEYNRITEITKKEIEEKRNEQNAEKRRINEKQIRSLRGRFRNAGFLNNQATPGEEQYTNKLGT